MRNWYQIQAGNNGPIEVMIYDEIGLWGITAADFRSEFDAAAESGRDIVISVNSPGGDVFDGIAIYNTISKHRDRTSVSIDGVAASIASVIALAGHERTMAEGTFFMIHNPWSFAAGDAEHLRKRAATLDQIREQMVNIYEENSSLSREQIIDAMDSETWYNADDAYQAGFAHQIEGEGDIAASAFDWRAFNYKRVPTPLADARRRSGAPKTVRELEENLIALGYSKNQAAAIAGHGLESIRRDSGIDDSRGEPGDETAFMRSAAQIFSY